MVLVSVQGQHEYFQLRQRGSFIRYQMKTSTVTQLLLWNGADITTRELMKTRRRIATLARKLYRSVETTYELKHILWC